MRLFHILSQQFSDLEDLNAREIGHAAAGCGVEGVIPSQALSERMTFEDVDRNRKIQLPITQPPVTDRD